jgi:hypothetical protein
MTDTPGAITVDDLRAKALRIRDMAEVEARHLAADRSAQVVAIGVVAVVAAISIAYYLGSRRR